MRTIMALCAIATLAGCASNRDPALDAYPNLRARDDIQRERAEDGVRNMQREFDALTGGAN